MCRACKRSWLEGRERDAAGEIVAPKERSFNGRVAAIKPAVLVDACKHWWKVDDSDKPHANEKGVQVYWKRCKRCKVAREVLAHPVDLRDISYAPRSEVGVAECPRLSISLATTTMTVANTPTLRLVRWQRRLLEPS